MQKNVELMLSLIEKKSSKEVEKAIELNPNLLELRDHTGLSLLHLAAWHNKPETVQLLINLGMDYNLLSRFDETPLDWAIVFHASKITKILLKNGANISPYSIHKAARTSTPKIIKRLVSFGANVHDKDKHGRTPLVYAQANNKPLNVNVLKKCGATE